MGTITVRSEHKGRSNSAQSGNDGHEGGGLLTQYCPSTLSANLSAVGGGLISAPAFSHNTVSGDVNIILNKIDVEVTPTTEPVINKYHRVAQEALDDDDTISKILIFADVKGQSDLLALEEENEESRECVHPPGEHVLSSLIGEITGTRVTADYLCDECGSAIRRFKGTAFRVKCTKCKKSWKCTKLQCTCSAEITIELSDRTKRPVVLSDSLLRSIVSCEREGYCNTDKIEEEVLKVDRIRVDYMDGHLSNVKRIALNM